nr:hypothetical protein [Tanacetum cinerariifolium]
MVLDMGIREVQGIRKVGIHRWVKAEGRNKMGHRTWTRVTRLSLYGIKIIYTLEHTQKQEEKKLRVEAALNATNVQNKT